MVRLVPDAPAFTTTSERVVWERLRDSLGAADVLMANVRLTDETKDHEADLIVLIPDVGVLVLEVKGGGIRWDGDWLIQRNGRDKRVDPVDQARKSKYALREYVEHDLRWIRGRRVSWAHGVATPFSEFPATFHLPDLPRWALHDKTDQDDLAERLVANARRLAHRQSAPTYDDVELMVEILNGPIPTARRATGRRSVPRTTSSTVTSSRLYVGMSRATDRLVVVGDPQVVKEIGGDAVAASSGSEPNIPVGRQPGNAGLTDRPLVALRLDNRELRFLRARGWVLSAPADHEEHHDRARQEQQVQRGHAEPQR